jgi:hypothetical protein
MNRNQKVNARNWLEYFEENLKRRLPIDWEQGVKLEGRYRKAIIGSLQKFQVGESGEGHHLKKYAAQTGDAQYCAAINLFIAEENYHAHMLERVLCSAGAPLLHGHWSDAAFIVIRRFGELELELMILLVAELIAKRYYRVLHDATTDANIRHMCIQILRDENAHVAFHCDTLNRSLALLPPFKRRWIRFWWKRFYHVVCGVVAWDHRGVLRAAGASRADWMKTTNAIFEQAAEQIFEPQPVGSQWPARGEALS